MNGGLALVPVARASDLEAQARRESTEQNQQPVIQGLASQVRGRWEIAKDSKRELEERMLQCLRQRRGEYDPDKLADIKRQGGSEIFIQLTSVKCRAATSWLRDALLGTGADKPWGLHSTPIPELPETVMQSLQQTMAQQLYQMALQGEQQPDPEALKAVAAQMKDAALRQVKESSSERIKRMEDRMEDQLVEGGFLKAFNQFLDDIVTFPFGVIKGPIKRKRTKLMWVGEELVPTEEIRNEWERIDPFNLYWAPWASDIQDGFVIERHKMTRGDLEALVGVEGYSEAALRTVMADFDTGGLREWLWTDSAQAEAEGKDTTEVVYNEDLIDAIQLWDTIAGQTLIDWDDSFKDVVDPQKPYACEVWLIGNTVIRAVINYDPLGRKPYYVTSYEQIPGAVAGHGVTDLCRDSQAMVNAAARSLANNMGISSGPQVGVNVSRLPAGSDITQMYPWKIWQFQAADYNDTSQPIQFFQPASNAQELMAVFEKFSARADEDTMIPRYMSGEYTPGAGRTSSGLAMLLSNAGKGIKQVISNIDQNIMIPLLERLYQDNLRYNPDPDMVGDVEVVAKGATNLVLKEAEAVRRNEFLSLVLNSPAAQQIVGLNGVAELLRESAKNLNGNVDRIVPDRQQVSVIEQQQQMIQQLQMQLAQLMGPEGQQKQPGATSQPKIEGVNILPDGSPAGGRDMNIMSPRPY
jgi:hypothetical protein